MFFTEKLKMTVFDITYKILKKLQGHQEPIVNGEVLYNELHEELCVYEFNFRYFLGFMQEQYFIKIERQNITDWGEIEIQEAGINYANEYPPNEYTDINFNNLWEYLDKQIIKHTEDLILAKKGAELHLGTQMEILETQQSLANRGLKNILSFQHKQVEFAKQAVYRIDKELEKRRILSMATANKTGEQTVTIIEIAPKITVRQALAENSETEWKQEAIAKGLQVGTVPYYNFVNTKKAEQKDKESEEQRKRDFAFYISPEYNYSPTIEDFMEEIAVQKLANAKATYVLFLRETKKIYKNARHYYTVWGARGTGIDRGPLYDEILVVINGEIEKGLIQNPAQIEPTPENTLTVKETNPVLQFNYSNNEGYFFSAKIEAFKQIENNLYQKKFIDDTGKWIKSKTLLCAFIHLLHGEYLKKTLPNKAAWASLLNYRRYFENRYKIDIRKAFQKKQFPPAKVKNYEPDFKFIFPIIEY